MGLGKTLTVISLILTNFHDGRPLAKPNLGYVRKKVEATRSVKGGKKKSSTGFSYEPNPNIGKKIQSSGKRRSAFGFFSAFDSNEEKEEMPKLNVMKKMGGAGVAPRRRSDDKSFIDDDSDSSDEFDDMCKVTYQNLNFSEINDQNGRIYLSSGYLIESRSKRKVLVIFR